MSKVDELIDTLKYKDDGLIPAVAQDENDGTVLMVAYMNKESLKMTIETGTATYWSRSRQKLWKKGESSGNVQKVSGIYTDCDKDTIVLKINQVGQAACHTGNRSCFYFEIKQDGTLEDQSKPLFDPNEVYKKS